jgi:membrane fusion protein (multidrug efflux system)
MKVSLIAAIIPGVVIPVLISLSLPGCEMAKGESHQEEHSTIVVTSPKAKDVTVTKSYVCRILSKRHIDVRALVDGYLKEILIKEGQPVKQGQVMFEILPVLYQAKYDAENAEALVAEIELYNTKKLYNDPMGQVVSIQDVKLHEAKLANLRAKADLAKAELQFTRIAAPFDGIVDRLHEREGSLIKERDILTTVSDNSVMWVYFNVPEAVYLEYMAHLGQNHDDQRIELVLADGNKFRYPSLGLTVEANFNIETGNIPFRADFPNPHGLLRHGQTGTVLIHRTLKNAVVIPQRATFEILDRRYVYVVDKDNLAHQRLITIEHELDDIYVIKSGLDAKDKIILEGAREVRDGDKVEYEVRPPEEVLANQKNHAE